MDIYLHRACYQQTQILLEKSLQGLRWLTTERLSVAALDRLDSRNQHHRQLITRKVEEYSTARQRTASLEQQSSILLKEVTHQQQSVKDIKRHLSKEMNKFEKTRRAHIKEENDLKVAIVRASQRLQRRLRHVSSSTFDSICTTHSS